MAGAVPTGIVSVARSGAVATFFFGLYLLLVGQAGAAELAIGAIVAVLAALYQLVLRRKSEPAPVTPVTLAPLLPALGALVRDTLSVAAALAAAPFGPPPGRVRVVAPPAGDPTSAAGRAIAIVAVSLAPNSIVVGSAFAADRLAVHRLAGEQPEPPT